MEKSFNTTETDHTAVIKELNRLASAHRELFMTTIGSSVLGKPIPALRIGKGDKKLLYVGCHHALERLTSALLLRFTEELCEYFSKGRQQYGISAEYIFKTRCIYIIPMLNPDGVEIALHGADAAPLLKDRLIKINRGSDDFSKWQANARGVDLNHNYNAGFEEYMKVEKEMGISGPAPSLYSGEFPESEPECAALCNFIRALEPFEYIFSFHTQGEEIYWEYNGNSPKKSKGAAQLLSRASGYRLCSPENKSANYGGLKDWYIEKFNRPAFTIECGRGENPLPPSQLAAIYITLRKMLFKSLIL